MIRVLPKSAIEPALRRAAAIVLLCWAGGTAAHEGHHEDEAPAQTPPAAPPAPPLNAETPQIELVVKRHQDQVLLYIDDYATDASLDGLQVEVRSGSRALQAAAAGEGVYSLPAELLDSAGAALEIEVHGPGVDTNVEGELPPAPAQTVSQTKSGHLRPPAWALGIAAVATLLSLLLFRLHLRRRALAA